MVKTLWDRKSESDRPAVRSQIALRLLCLKIPIESKVDRTTSDRNRDYQVKCSHAHPQGGGAIDRTLS